MQNETFVSLSFKRLAQVGEDIIRSAFLWSQIKIKRYPQFWVDVFPFKMKNLKPCKGFKPNTYKGMSFPQKCAKGCP